MDTPESSSNNSIGEEDPPRAKQKISSDPPEPQLKLESLHTELESIQSSYWTLQSESRETEANMVLLRQQKDEALEKNVQLIKALEEVSKERDALQRIEASSREQEDDLIRKIEEEKREKEEIRTELDVCREKMVKMLDQKSEKARVFLSRKLEDFKSLKDCLARVIESLDDNQLEKIVDRSEIREESELDEELSAFSVELDAISKLANEVESKMKWYQDKCKKEKRELENSVVSLTEETRDINSLLRIALVEKEAVEKSLNRLKGNNDQKGPILKIAERIGFGFMMGNGVNEPLSDNSSSTHTVAISEDGSECEEDAVSLASTVERIMKNSRLEITQLRKSLEESRSDTERLQSFTEKQSQKLAENALYIKELEHRETLLTQNVEELLLVIKETEEEVARWREACELEVEAGKNLVEERDKMVMILKQELEKTKASLNIANGKLKLKEELAEAAMAAQAAAERSLLLADSRASELRERIEAITRQLEEAEKRERGQRRKVRHICWPFRLLRFSPTNTANPAVQKVKYMLPEMQALLH